ncbi:MAG: hypothetical protein EOP04_12170 [Proteobacteria bacterium]|nr:MAG: hypothetical protein EOP04_12170 [Pseudomonadota bacterium]
MDDPFPTELKEFLKNHLSSVEQVEILLLLFRNREKSWSIVEIDARIRTDPSSIKIRLQGLMRDGLVIARTDADLDKFQFSENIENLRGCQLLDDFYPSYSTRIIELMFSGPSECIRDLADAFRIRK